MKSRLIVFWVLLTAVFFLHTNALPSEPLSKGRRLIGHGITEGAIEFGQAFTLARDAGLEFIELPRAWDSIETAPGRSHSNILTIANAFFPARDIKIFLTVNPIDINNLRMPADLKNEAFDELKHQVQVRNWQKFEFVFGEFSIDEKTRRDGRLEPGKIVNLIIAEPPAVADQTKGARTVWVSNLVFE
jgi:hypothetical protein